MAIKNKNTASGKVFVGTVVSDKMANTLVVVLDYKFRHPLYKKIIKRRKKLYAENNLNAKLGQAIKVREVRPLSRLKRFTTVEIIK